MEAAETEVIKNLLYLDSRRRRQHQFSREGEFGKDGLGIISGWQFKRRDLLFVVYQQECGGVRMSERGSWDKPSVCLELASEGEQRRREEHLGFFTHTHTLHIYL